MTLHPIRSPRFGKALWLVLLLNLLVSACRSNEVMSVFRSPMEVEGLEVYQGKGGQGISFFGSGFTAEELSITADDQTVAYTLDSDTKGVLTLPEFSESGVVKISFVQSGETISVQPLLYTSGDSSEGVFFNAKDICEDQIFRDASGTLVRGERICDTNLPSCSSEGQERCLTSSDYLAVDTSTLAQSLAEGETVLGIAGAATDKLNACTADGQVECTTTDTFKALRQSDVDASKLRAGKSLAGVAGLFPSAAAPFTQGTAQTALTSANFLASLKSTAVFEWFDSAGNVFTASGSDQIVPLNVMYGTSLFQTIGSLGAGTLAPPSISIVNTGQDYLKVHVNSVCCAVAKLLVVASRSPVTFSPTDGVAYPAETSPDENNAYSIIYNGGDGDVSLYNLSPNRMYYVKAWAYKESSLEYSRASTQLYPKTSFPVSFANETWNARSVKSQDVASAYPTFDSGSQYLILTDSTTQYQFNAMNSTLGRALPLTVAFDYKVTSTGGQGFAFIFGKDFTEYAYKTMQGDASLGLLRGTGYAVAFQIASGNIALIDLSNNATLAEKGSVDLYDASKNYEHHVKVSLGASQISVYLDDESTPVLTYQPNSPWDMTYPYLGFSTATGASVAQMSLKALSITSP